MSRIGIYGGTFDPVHVGHLILAERCREELELDEVWFVPAARPPHKSGRLISPARDRCAMLEFAISGNPKFRISRVELDRDSAEPSYTVMTLEQLAAETPGRELYLLLGADSVRELSTWREPRRILELATVVGVNRGADGLPDAAELVRPWAGVAADRIRWVQMPGMEISSTDIRLRAARGRSVRYLVPRAVEIYLQQNGIYTAEKSSDEFARGATPDSPLH